MIATSYLLVFKLRLQLLIVLDLPCGLHEILLDAVVSVLADGEHAGLSADVTQICSVELLADFGEGFEVYVSLCCD